MEYIKPKAPWTLTHDETSCVGQVEEDEYIAEYGEEGSFLVKTGRKINIQNKIQAYAEDCDLSIILKNLLEAGVDVTKGVTFTDDIIDYTPLQDASLNDMIQAKKNYEKNLAYYEAEIERLKAEAKANNNGGNENE